MIPSQRLRYLSSFINQRDELPKDIKRQEWLLLWQLSPDAPSRELLKKLLRRMMVKITGLWK